MVKMYAVEMSDIAAQHNLGTVLLSLQPDFGKLWGKLILYIGDIIFHAPRRYATEMWPK